MTAPATEPASSPKPAATGVLTWVVSLGLVIGLGLAAGIVAGKLTAGRQPAQAEKDEKETAPPHTPAAPQDPRRVGELIEEGRFLQALDACRADADAQGRLPLPLRYRLALCLEALARPAEALAAFRECITPAASPYLRAAAQLGIARTALQQGRADEGREMLCALLVRSAQPGVRSRPYQAEARVLLALSLAEDLLSKDDPSATRPGALARTGFIPSPERYVDWDGPAREPLAGETPARGLRVSIPPESRVDAALDAEGLVDLLERLAKAAGYKAAWGPGAKDALLGRVSELVCRGTPLANVLLWLTLPHGIVVTIDKEAIRFDRLNQRSAAQQTKYRQQLAGECLRAALVVGEEQPLYGHVYLSLGNLDEQAGRPADATAWYLRLLRDRPRSPAVTAATYNLGLLRLRKGERAAARHAFFQAIDRAPGHELTGLCYWWVGRSHLDEADVPSARNMLLRALAAKADRATAQTRTAAALGLACASLFEEQPRSAWKALNEGRQGMQQPPFAEPAAVLDALARHELAEDARRRSAVLVELVPVLLRPRDEPWLGPMLPYLRARALGKLGMTEEMDGVCEKNANQLPGVLVQQLQVEVGEAYLRKGNDALARTRLERMVAPNATPLPKPLLHRVNLALAGLDLRGNQADRCLSRCWSMLEDKAVDSGPVLSLMGQAYARKKDYARASDCLAGKIPPR